MSHQDIIDASSAAIPMWDGKQLNLFTNIVRNNTSSLPLLSIVNSYGVGLGGASFTQSLVVGPRIALGIVGPTYAPLTSQIILADTSGGVLDITLPAATAAYAGMVITVKDYTDSFSTHTCTVTAGAGTTVENIGLQGHYGASTGLITSHAWTFCFDGISKWVLIGTT